MISLYHLLAEKNAGTGICRNLRTKAFLKCCASVARSEEGDNPLMLSGSLMSKYFTTEQVLEESIGHRSHAYMVKTFSKTDHMILITFQYWLVMVYKKCDLNMPGLKMVGLNEVLLIAFPRSLITPCCAVF